MAPELAKLHVKVARRVVEGKPPEGAGKNGVVVYGFGSRQGEQMFFWGLWTKDYTKLSRCVETVLLVAPRLADGSSVLF